MRMCRQSSEQRIQPDALKNCAPVNAGTVRQKIMRDYYNSKLGLFFIQKFIPYSSFLGYALILIFYGLKAYPLIIPIAATMEPLKLIAILVFRKIGPYKIALNPSNNKIIFFLPYKGGEKE